MRHHILHLVPALVALAVSCSTPSASDDLRYKVSGSDIIVDASDLLDKMPRGHLEQSAATLGVDWLYNDYALQFKTNAGFTISNYYKDIVFPEGGTYYLYVRSMGVKQLQSFQKVSDLQPTARTNANGSFRIRVNDEYVDGEFGTTLSPQLVKAATYKVAKGETAQIQITRMIGNSAIDCIVFSKNPDLTDADLIKKQFPEDVVLLHEYTIPETTDIHFGDLNGDGKTDFVAIAEDYSAFAYDNSGRLLWSWTAPDEGGVYLDNEAAAVVWDLDRDGKAELVHWREDEEGEWLVVADGMSGEVLRKTQWPAASKPHPFNNYRLAIANTDGIYPSSIVLYSDGLSRITYGLYDAQLNEIWRHEYETKKDHLGHFFYPHDLNGDGIDEIIGGWRAIDASGRIIWSKLEDIYDNHDHVDSYRFYDFDEDGRDELVMATSDLGVQLRDALSGRLLSAMEGEHCQHAIAGHFLAGRKKPQIAAAVRFYGDRRVDPYLASQVYWYTPEGELISRWPANPINSNPSIYSCDFYGTGKPVCLWHRFMMLPDGRGKLYFTGEITHCFDFERNGYEQVVTTEGTKMRIWGYSGARNGKPNNDPDYLKEHMANITHY